MDTAAFLRRRASGLSGVGLALGTLFFPAALTPALVPRTHLAQGVLAGVCFAVGYGLGVAWRCVDAWVAVTDVRD